MPLFFFHLRVGEHLDKDVLGVELADVADAHRQAIWAIGDMMRDAALTGTASCGDMFEITDRDGRPVLKVPFDATFDRARAG